MAYVLEALKRRRLIRTMHQNTSCKYCADNATKYNHCSFCGASFRRLEDLTEHQN